MNQQDPMIISFGQAQRPAEENVPDVFRYETSNELGPVKSLLAAHQQMAAVETIGATTAKAQEEVAGIRQRGLETYDAAVYQMLAVRNRERESEHQALVASYATQSLQLLRRDLSAIEMLGVIGVAKQVERSSGSSEK